MARQSRWSNFADAFNSVYGVTNQIGRTLETRRVMDKEDWVDEQGNALTGDALQRARYDALAGIEEKYGTAKGALDIRSGFEDYNTKSMNNRLLEDTYDERVWQQGIGASGEIRSRTALNSANAGLAGARTRGVNLENEYNAGTLESRIAAQRAADEAATARDTGQTTAYRDPSYVESLVNTQRQTSTEAALAAQRGLQTQAAEAQPEVVDAGLREAAATARASASNAAVEAANAQTDEGVATNPVYQGRRAGIAMAESATQQANAEQQRDATLRAQQDDQIMASILGEAVTMDFGDNTAAADAWVIDQMAKRGVSPERAKATAESVRRFGLERIGARAAELTQQAEAAYRKGGLDAVADLYDNVNDGVDGRVVRDGNQVSVVVTRNGREEVVASASGPDAERIVAGQAMEIFRNPMRTMEIAAAAVEYDTSRAKLESERARTRLTDAQVDQIASNINVDAARIRQIESSIDVDDARILELVARTAGQELENETYMQNFEVALENTRSQIAARGVATQLDEAQMTLVAAQVAKAYADIDRLDPNRETSPRERQEFLDEQFTSILRNALALGSDVSPEEIRSMRALFEAGMMPQGISHSQN